MNVYGYCRVSTLKQAENGESIDVQKRRIKGYAQMQGFDLKHIYVDRGVSGSKPLGVRKNGEKLLKIIQSGDAIISSKLDRVFRNAEDALATSKTLKKDNIELHLLDLGGDVNNSGIGKFFFTVIAAFAELERDKTAERISEVKADQRKMGKYLGGKKPFGFTVDEVGFLVEDHYEQQIIVDMRKLRKRGKGYLAISKLILENHGYPLSHMGVKKILARPENQKPLPKLKRIPLKKSVTKE